MFDGLKNMGDMVKKAKEMKDKMQEVQKQLKELVVEGEAASGRIKVKMSGELDVIAVDIDEKLLAPKNKGALEKAITKAVNEAAEKAKKAASGQLSEISDGLQIPGLT